MMKKVTALLLSLLFLVTCMPLLAGAEEGEAATVEIWSGDPQEYHQYTIDKFNEVYPNIQIHMTVVAHADQPQKLQAALAAGLDMPDIVWAEIGVRGTLFSITDLFEDLSQAPFNADEGLLLDWLPAISKNAEGALLGIEHAPAVLGMAYNRALCKEYFGTDDPAELEAMFATWDDYVTHGKDVLEKSGGAVKMFASLGDVYSAMKNQNNSEYTVDTDEGVQLNLTATLSDVFAEMIKYEEAGIVGKIDQWDSSWMTSFTTDEYIFYPCPQWGLTWMLKANDPDSVGKWGYMSLTGGTATWGGTVLCIPQKAAQKEAAWTFIQWLHLTEEGAKAKLEGNEFFTALKSVYEIDGFYSFEDPYFGGQDVWAAMSEDLTQVVDQRPVNKYDEAVSDAANLAIQHLNLSGTSTPEEMIQLMEDDIVAMYPDLLPSYK